MEKRIGVLIRTYDRDIGNLFSLIKTLKSAGHYVVTGYDLVEKLPSMSAIRMCDFFFLHSGNGDAWHRKQHGAVYQHRMGIKILADWNCRYTFIINGDSVITRPEKIPALVDFLGADDIMTTQWWDQCGTLLLFGYTDKMYKLFHDVGDGGPQFERKVTLAMKRNNIAYAIHECTDDDMGVWETIGFHRISKNYNP